MLKKAQAGINTGTTEGRKGRKPKGSRPQAQSCYTPPADSSELPKTQQATLARGLPSCRRSGMSDKSLTEVSGSREDHLALSPSQ